MSNDYRDFLDSKRVKALPTGFSATLSQPCKLFPWQKQIVEWALKLGRAAIFADCGLGKTAMQVTWADYVAARTKEPVLILAPLAVAPQTVAEGEKFGIEVTHVESQLEIVSGTPGVYVTNSDKLLSGRFDPSKFAGVVLDESSILKSYAGTTKQYLIGVFEYCRFRLACTATPAPNDHVELGNHAQFLGVMNSNEMLARWFITDQGEAGKYRLKKHAAADFWRWVASWAVCLSSPADLGYPATGFDLPKLNLIEEEVSIDESDASTGSLFRTQRLSATTLHQEMRLTAPVRAQRVAQLVRNSNSDQAWVIWCNTNYEADELKKLIPEAIEVRGSDSEAFKESQLVGFAKGCPRVIITKPSIAGFGLNWQHCHHMAFTGLSFSHEQFYQAVRRCYRFGQTNPVNAHIITAGSAEGDILSVIRRKESQRQEMLSSMIEATRVHGIGATMPKPLIPSPREKVTGENWELHLGDCCEVIKDIPDNSVGLTVFSPPFSSLYIYSDAEADMGNSADDEEFFEHFGYLVPELLRATIPGRLCVVHCKDLPKYRGRDGAAGLRDFPGQIIRLFEAHGWQYHSRVTIWKCPVTEMQRTKNNGLLYKTLRRDASQSRQGMADYLVVFRKWQGLEKGDSPNPVEHDREEFPLELWQRYASPVWMDIEQMDVLNASIAKDERDEKHICPLQLDVIERVVNLWSSPGDLVLSPFAGIGSEGWVSLRMGRKFTGIELKREYWRQAARHCERAAQAGYQPSLFEFQLEESA